MQRCLVCLHPALPQIDAALSDNGAVSLLAVEHNLPLFALADHAANHTEKPAPEFKEVPAQYHVQHLLAKALSPAANPIHLLYARPQSDALPALTRLLALAAKLPPTPESKGFIEKHWWETRARLVAALEPYPEAKQAVSRALDDSPKMF